jgi:hypothetical protein
VIITLSRVLEHTEEFGQEAFSGMLLKSDHYRDRPRTVCLTLRDEPPDWKSSAHVYVLSHSCPHHKDNITPDEVHSLKLELKATAHTR